MDGILILNTISIAGATAGLLLRRVKEQLMGKLIVFILLQDIFPELERQYCEKDKKICYNHKLSSSSLTRKPYVGPGLPQKLLPAEVSGYCFFRFRDKSLFQGGVSPAPNPLLSWRFDFPVRVVSLS
jgi:hypothetical protein